MKVFVDANIILSAALFPDGQVARVYARLCEQGHQIVSSSYVMGQVREVVRYAFADSSQQVELFIGMFRVNDLLVEPLVDASRDAELVRQERLIADPRDRPVLRAAVAGRADVLLTGDHALWRAPITVIQVASPAALNHLIR
jgi:predicted nucleic acid-binding protein